ncbi:MAG: response regulator [Candidatus Sungbacteria bacterium]|nr:response regulator [Candidatus Sungbacteria bacterium]
MPKKILIVEDDRSLQSALTEMLEKHQYAAVSAFDGEAGLAAAEKEKPDLILLDIILPKKDGFAFLQEMKQNPNIASIPVIVLTNLEDSADIERALGLGAQIFLVKTDYQLEEIAEKITQTLHETHNA